MKNNDRNNVATENKEGEKNMEQKKITIVELKTAMENANNARANTDSLIACEYLDAMDEMDSTFELYNRQQLSNQYHEMKTLEQLFKRGYYSPVHSQWDKKNNTFKAVSRVTRFNALDFVGVKKIDTTFPQKIKTLAEKMAAFIKSEVQYDNNGGKKAVNIKEIVPALQAVMDCVGIEGVIARNRDVRFLAYACTGGSGSIGSLREVNPSRVATMLVDVYAVQMNNGVYDFEKKGNENK